MLPTDRATFARLVREHLAGHSRPDGSLPLDPATVAEELALVFWQPERCRCGELLLASGACPVGDDAARHGRAAPKLVRTVIGWTLDDDGIADRVGVYVVEHAEGIDAVKVAREAIAAFLLTPEGREANEETSGDFNWGDATGSHADVLERAGLRLVERLSSDVVVRHDELLAR